MQSIKRLIIWKCIVQEDALVSKEPLTRNLTFVYQYHSRAAFESKFIGQTTDKICDSPTLNDIVTTSRLEGISKIHFTLFWIRVNLNNFWIFTLLLWWDSGGLTWKKKYIKMLPFSEIIIFYRHLKKLSKIKDVLYKFERLNPSTNVSKDCFCLKKHNRECYLNAWKWLIASLIWLKCRVLVAEMALKTK